MKLLILTKRHLIAAGFALLIGCTAVAVAASTAAKTVQTAVNFTRLKKEPSPLAKRDQFFHLHRVYSSLPTWPAEGPTVRVKKLRETD